LSRLGSGFYRDSEMQYPLTTEYTFVLNAKKSESHYVALKEAEW
jgi:hypothetical protein